MRIPADPLDAAALDAALVPGQEQHFRHSVLVDWSGDGLYAHALSDLSSAVSAASLSIELDNSTPGSEATLSGAAAAQLSVVMEGSLLVGGEYVPANEVFAPYNTSSALYLTRAPGKAIRYSIDVWTSRGWISTRQFTGWIDECTVRRGANRVELTALAIPPALRDPTFWPGWAVDGPAAARLQDYAPQRGLASSVVDYILNRAGLRTRPRPPWEHLTGVFALTWVPLSGSFAPAAGKLFSQAPWGNFQLFPEVYKISPGIDPNGEYWVTGPFGLARAGKANVFPGSMIYTTRDMLPTWTGYSTSISAWIYCGPTAPGYPSSSATLKPPVVQVYYGYAITTNYYAYRLSLASDGTTIQIQVEPGTDKIYRTTWTPGTDAWRHIQVELDHSAGPVQARLLVDGVVQSTFVPTGTSNSEAATALNVLFTPRLGFHLRPGVRICDAMAWQQAGAPTVTPERTVTVRAVVDRSLNEISYLPAPGEDGWQTCKDIAEAELAAWIVDADGMLYYRNRDNIRTSTAQQTLTVSYPSDVGTLDTVDGVANTVTISVQSGEATWRNAWEASTVDQVVSAPGATTFVFPIDEDVIAVESGTVPRLFQSAASTSTLPVWSSKVDSGYVFVFDATETETTNQNMVGVIDQTGFSDGQFIRIVITNTTTQTGRFRLKSDDTTGTDPQPALRIAGLVLTKTPVEVRSVASEANVIADGRVRAISLPGGAWHQHLDSVSQTARFVLRRSTQAIPTWDRIETPGDPRREIADRFLLQLGPAGQRVPTFAVGIERTLDSTGLRDTLVLRATSGPDGWVLEDEVLGLLETTARLG